MTAPARVASFERQLAENSELAERILSDSALFPPVPQSPERIIRCSPENLEQAICRQFARCREWGEFWRVEITE
ncbi:MAG TPA: hypothetical protein VMW54_14675 [Terriglobia bacterium]|nr:hypothetical protein [Terriglobia bacterium]